MPCYVLSSLGFDVTFLVLINILGRGLRRPRLAMGIFYLDRVMASSSLINQGSKDSKGIFPIKTGAPYMVQITS
jgi:hypothetical protein